MRVTRVVLIGAVIAAVLTSAAPANAVTNGSISGALSDPLFGPSAGSISLLNASTGATVKQVSAFFNYQFTNVPPGSYLVMADMTFNTSLATEMYDSAYTTAAATPVVVGDGQAVVGKDIHFEVGG